MGDTTSTLEPRASWPDLPPGPELSEQEQTFAWFSRPYALLEESSARFGDRFTLRVTGWGTQVVVADPEAIRDTFLAPADVLLGGHANDFLRPLVGRHSLLLRDGDAHLGERKRLLPVFQGGRLREYGRLIQEICRAGTRRWPDGAPFAVHDALGAVSLEVIFRAVFGLGDDAHHQPIRRLLASLMRLVSSSIAGSGVGGDDGPFQRVRQALGAALAAECAARRATPGSGRSDVMQLLLDARHEDGSPPTDEELRDQLLTLLAAGHETTATAMTWALSLLAEHAHALARLRHELAALGPERDPDAVARLPYLQAVVNETLRLRPVIPAVSRRVARPVRIGGMDLRPGVHVAPCIYLAHRRAGRFPDPDRFVPERFLHGDFGPNEFLPFGGGLRRCIGMGFAVYEMKLILAEIVATFDLENARRSEPRPVRKTVVVAPSEGGRMRVARLRVTNANEVTR